MQKPQQNIDLKWDQERRKLLPPIERHTVKEMRNGVIFEASLIIYTRHDLGMGKTNVRRIQCANQKKIPYEKSFSENYAHMVIILPWRYGSSINSNSVCILQEFQWCYSRTQLLWLQLLIENSFCIFPEKVERRQKWYNEKHTYLIPILCINVNMSSHLVSMSHDTASSKESGKLHLKLFCLK